MEAFYDGIDLLVMPSIYEPFGMAALEAAAMGIPVVCNCVDGLVEILGEYAFYYESDTYDAFRAAMYRWLSADEETLQYTIRGAMNRYRTRFTDTKMAEQYKKRFDGLMPTKLSI